MLIKRKRVDLRSNWVEINSDLYPKVISFIHLGIETYEEITNRTFRTLPVYFEICGKYYNVD